MKVTGKHTETIVKKLDVEIDPVHVLDKIYFSTVPTGLAYIRDGYWYRQDGYDYHRNDELYKKDREATPEEMTNYVAWQHMQKIAKKLKE